MNAPRQIRNSDVIAPGTRVVRAYRGTVVFEILETNMRGPYLEGRMRDTRNGRSVGWHDLIEFRIVDGDDQ